MRKGNSANTNPLNGKLMVRERETFGSCMLKQYLMQLVNQIHLFINHKQIFSQPISLNTWDRNPTVLAQKHSIHQIFRTQSSLKKVCYLCAF